MSQSGKHPVPRTYDDFVREARALIREVDVAQAGAAHAAGALFLDVREPHEVAGRAVPDALVIPRGRLESDAPDWIFEPGGMLIVYCSTGKRSALAVKTLLEMGFTGAVSLAGGFAAWQAASHPVGAPRPM